MNYDNVPLKVILQSDPCSEISVLRRAVSCLSSSNCNSAISFSFGSHPTTDRTNLDSLGSNQLKTITKEAVLSDEVFATNGGPAGRQGRRSDGLPNTKFGHFPLKGLLLLTPADFGSREFCLSSLRSCGRIADGKLRYGKLLPQFPRSIDRFGMCNSYTAVLLFGRTWLFPPAVELPLVVKHERFRYPFPQNSCRRRYPPSVSCPLPKLYARSPDCGGRWRELRCSCETRPAQPQISPTRKSALAGHGVRSSVHRQLLDPYLMHCGL
jgi:hypothetical protein